MSIVISGELLEKLQQVATKKQQSIETYLEEMIEKDYTSPDEETLVDRILASVEAMPRFGSEETNIAENSREILENEFAEYLIARMNRPMDNQNHD